MTSRPNPLPRFYRWRTNLFQTPLLTVITAICASLSLLISLVDKSGSAQHRIAQQWAKLCVWCSGSKLIVRGSGEPAQAFGGRLRVKPHFLHGYAGHLCSVAVPVPYSCTEGTVAHCVYWLVSEPVRSDSHRYSQPPRLALKPGCGRQGPAFRNATFCLSRKAGAPPPAN